MKVILGFILGIMVASAVAQPIELWRNIKTNLLSGVNPTGDGSIIHVDVDGYVICSTERKP